MNEEDITILGWEVQEETAKTITELIRAEWMGKFFVFRMMYSRDVQTDAAFSISWIRQHQARNILSDLLVGQ